MNSKILTIGIIVLLIAVGAVYFMSKNSTSPAATEYCSQDGTLSNTQAIQSHRSYCIKSNIATTHLMPNEPVSFQFSIVDDQGNTLKDFQMTHDMLLHLIVIRKDLANFQHLHPELDASTGTFTLSNLTFPTSGSYRLYADFTPKGAMMGPDGIPLGVTLIQDASVIGNYTAQALKLDPTTKTFDGYNVTLTADPKVLVAGTDMLSFTIKKDGKSVTDLQHYLAALGHSVIIREGTLDYIHAHAVQAPTDVQNGTIDFHVEFPSEGTYKVFTQFKHQDKVVTTDFVVSVTGGAPRTPPMQTEMKIMDHSMH